MSNIKYVKMAIMLLLFALISVSLFACGPGEHDHKFEEHSRVEATCITEGKTIYRCSVCGEESEEELPLKEHNFSVVLTEPTCTQDGRKDFICIDCGYTETEVLPATGHDFGEITVITPPTEDEEGTGEHICSVCGAVEQVVLEKLPHEHVYIPTVIPPTCIEEGYTLYICRCGSSFKDSFTPTVDHTYGIWTETVKPTLETEGESQHVCEYCGHVETRAVAKLSFEVPEETPEEGYENHIDTHVLMSFVGDCMLASERDRDVTNAFKYYARDKEPEYFFAEVQDYFGTDDFTVVNLENVLTDNKLKEITKTGTRVFWYRGPTSNVNILTHGSVEGVTFANNHANDYGRQGYLDTIETLENAGLNYGVNDKITYYTKDGYRVAVICCTLYGSYQTDDVIKKVEEASARSDYQVVYFHGGEMYSYSPEKWMVTAVHAIVDAGADCVLGAHPHVLRPYEYYNGAHIVYSLGNFCYGGKNYPINATIIFRLDIEVIDGKTANVTPIFVPCYVYTGKMNNYQPAVMPEGADKQQVLDFLQGKVKLPYIE